MNLKLTDTVIAEISRLLQVAMLTGTDVVDNLRLLEVQIDPDQDGFITLTDEYIERSENNIEKMLELASQAGDNNG